MNLKDFNNKHKGETIFILGNGEELGSLTEEQLSYIKEHTTIGVNYSHLIHTPSYMISGHFSQILYAQNYAKIDDIDRIFFQYKGAINGEVFDAFNEFKNMTKVNVEYFYNNTSIKVVKKASDTDNYLVGAANILISATNLAYIMGAERIIFIGFNQRNRLHFYDLNEDMKKELKKNISNLKKKYSGRNKMDVINKDFDMFISHMISEEELRKTAFFNPDVSPGIKKIFEITKNDGVELVSTEKKSKLVDCGATHVSFEDVLK